MLSEAPGVHRAIFRHIYWDETRVGKCNHTDDCTRNGKSVKTRVEVEMGRGMVVDKPMLVKHSERKTLREEFVCTSNKCLSINEDVTYKEIKNSTNKPQVIL
jgi:hypothetical protein